MIEFIFTTDSAPATDGGSDFPDDATTDHAFMVRSGIYDDGADQNDKNSAYYNKLSQNIKVLLTTVKLSRTSMGIILPYRKPRHINDRKIYA